MKHPDAGHPDEVETCLRCGGPAELFDVGGPLLHYACPACEIFFELDRKTLKKGKVQTFRQFEAGQCRWATRRVKAAKKKGVR